MVGRSRFGVVSRVFERPGPNGTGPRSVRMQLECGPSPIDRPSYYVKVPVPEGCLVRSMVTPLWSLPLMGGYGNCNDHDVSVHSTIKVVSRTVGNPGGPLFYHLDVSWIIRTDWP